MNREKEIYRVTLLGTAINALLVALKFVAGTVGRSSAMLADAVHSLSDFLTDIVVLIFVRISVKPKDKGHDYGHGKFETFATLIIGVLLAVAGILLFVNGAEKVVACLRGEVQGPPEMLALIIAVLSIVSKEWLYRFTVRRGRQLNSPAVEANAWHHRSDAISSIGTLVGVAGAMFLGTRWRILDPIAATVVSIFIIKTAYDIMRPSVNELLDSSLPDDVERQITDIVTSVPGIVSIHNLRTRRIGSNIAIELHARMDGHLTLTEAHALASRAELLIKEHFGPQTLITIHMEPLK